VRRFYLRHAEASARHMTRTEERVTAVMAASGKGPSEVVGKLKEESMSA
jgi:hypothetical protein